MRLSRSMSIAAALLLAACTRANAQEQFSTLVLEARAQEGESVLKQAFALQEGYRADTERYATTFDELREAGWEDPPGLRFYQPPRIVRAKGDELCIVIEPVPAQPDLWPQHVDQAGQVQRGPCPED